MIAYKTFVTLTALSVLKVLSGCVVGQSLPANYEPGPAVAVSGITIAVNVRDERPYIKSGDKPPYFIGKYRGGFGNPWDVTTKDKEPLADSLRRDIAKELQALGHLVVSAGTETRMLDVAIRDWNFDGMVDGKFWYEMDAKVLNRDGHLLAQSTVQDRHFVEGSVWTGAKKGFEAKMPELYASAIHKLVRDNTAISAALAGPVR